MIFTHIQTYFILILIILLVFSIFNTHFEKTHEDKSVFDEKKVKNTIKNATMIDGIIRIFYDLSFLTV